MKVLIIGRTGQLARELGRRPWPKGWTVEFAGRAEIDLAFPATVAPAIFSRRPDLIVNAAAYTAVDRAESEVEMAYRVNARSVEAMAKASAELDRPLVSFSTDYVFSGAKTTAYRETDPVCPLGAYGCSKAAGEDLIRAAHDWHLILRTSWVFSPFGSNFVKTMLRLGREKQSLGIVADQRGKPTYAGDLADAAIAASEAALADRSRSGTYHVANADATTWYEFALEIFREAKNRGARVPESIHPITTAEYPTPAKRPPNSELNCHKFERAFGIELRSWREALPPVIEELLMAAVAA